MAPLSERAASMMGEGGSENDVANAWELCTMLAKLSEVGSHAPREALAWALDPRGYQIKQLI